MGRRRSVVLRPFSVGDLTRAAGILGVQSAAAKALAEWSARRDEIPPIHVWLDQDSTIIVGPDPREASQ